MRRFILSCVLALSASAQAGALPRPTFRLTGDWQVEVSAGNLSATFDIEPTNREAVRGEKMALPLRAATAVTRFEGLVFGAIKAQECAVTAALVKGSVVVRRADGTVLAAERDYKVDSFWGRIMGVDGGALKAGETVLVDYGFCRRRLDSVVLTKAGKLELRKGAPHVVTPALPPLAAGERRVANVWTEGRTAKLGDENVFPVEVETPGAPVADGIAAKRLLPKTWAKLSRGEKVRILAWGDSVTEVEYLPHRERDSWQAIVARRLKAKFPKAQIEVVTRAWAGRPSKAFVEAPAGDVHNFETAILSVRPDLCVTEFVNDAKDGAEAMNLRYEKIRTAFAAQGTEWCLFTPHYIRWDWMELGGQKHCDLDPRPYVRAVRAFCAAKGVACADASRYWGRLWRRGIPYMSLLVNDINHPNEEGVSYYADAFMDLFAGDETPGETLYNGIVLPGSWPPKIDLANAGAMRVPYLEPGGQPKTIPIDVGRQLFVDDFLVARKEGIRRVYNHPVKFEGNPVLKPETKFELNRPGNAVALPKGGGMWWDARRKVFRLWYEGGWCYRMAYAESKDGLHWERPDLGFDKETPNRLLTGLKLDSWSVVYDPDTKDDSARWKLQCQRGCAAHRNGQNYLFVSPDGFNWRGVGDSGLCNDRSTMFYNPFRKKWVFSIRDTPFWYERNDQGRCRSYWETSEFSAAGAAWDWWAEAGPTTPVPWQQGETADPVDREFPDFPQLYNFDAVAYESVMLGFREILHGPGNWACSRHGLPKVTDLVFAYSRDGFHFSCPDRTPAIASERWNAYGKKWDVGYVQPLGNLCVVMGDELWFYYGAFGGDKTRLEPDRQNNCAFNGMYDNGAMGLAKLRRDGFVGLRADGRGVVTTRTVTFSGRHLFVNADAAQGSLGVEAIDTNGKVLAAFAPVRKDGTKLALAPTSGSLASCVGKRVRFRFTLDKATLYSFWVSKSARGESGGYLAGGGPGYAGIRDL